MKESVAKIYSKKTGLGVEYFTNQHGIQFYTGNMMLDKYIGKYDKSYGFAIWNVFRTTTFSRCY